ncbi:MAG: hypothetical protein AVDCRST_MAG55-1028, partial [uncultured Rubrobacteraceae bacterium]
ALSDLGRCLLVDATGDTPLRRCGSALLDGGDGRGGAGDFFVSGIL